MHKAIQVYLIAYLLSLACSSNEAPGRLLLQPELKFLSEFILGIDVHYQGSRQVLPAKQQIYCHVCTHLRGGCKDKIYTYNFLYKRNE